MYYFGAMSVSIKRSGIVLVAMIGCLFSVAVAQPEIANRSFENGTAPGKRRKFLAPGSNAIEGWTVVDGNI